MIEISNLYKSFEGDREKVLAVSDASIRERILRRDQGADIFGRDGGLSVSGR